jgi:UDP-N-acetylglucosamine 3-dehydrogenase
MREHVAPLRAGVIGIGAMGRNHVRLLRVLDGVHLVALCDPLGDPGGIALGIPVLTRVEDFLECDLDLAVVAVPTIHHEEVGLQLAEAGVHTLIEKPLATDLVGARRLVTAFEQRGLVGCVGHVERYNPALQSLRKRLEAAELGEIFQLATRRQGPFSQRIEDVGAVKDLATHDLDLTAWVAGSPFTAISARTAHKSGRAHEDLLVATGVLANGTITNHLVNWLSPLKERVTVVTGERGAFVADTLAADLTFYANASVLTEWDVISRFRGVSEGDMVRYAIAKPEPLRVELEAFRDAVLDKRHDIVPMSEGLAAVEAAEAALESAAKGVTVDLAC